MSLMTVTQYKSHFGEVKTFKHLFSILFYAGRTNHCWKMICRCKITPGCFLLQRKCRMRKLSISIVSSLQASPGLVYQSLQPGQGQTWSLSGGNKARDKRPAGVKGNRKTLSSTPAMLAISQ